MRIAHGLHVVAIRLQHSKPVQLVSKVTTTCKYWNYWWERKPKNQRTASVLESINLTKTAKHCLTKAGVAMMMLNRCTIGCQNILH